MTTEIEMPRDVKFVSSFANVKLAGTTWGHSLYCCRDKKANRSNTEGDGRYLFIISDNEGQSDYINIYDGSVLSRTKWSSVHRCASDRGFNGDFAKTRIMACLIAGIDPPTKQNQTWYYLKNVTGPEQNGAVTLDKQVSVEVSLKERLVRLTIGTSGYIGSIKVIPTVDKAFPNIDWRDEFLK